MEQNAFNGHIKGINRDVANNLRDDNSYWDATNFLLRKADSVNSVGDLENLLGDTKTFSFPNIPIAYRGIPTRAVNGSLIRVVGGVRMNDYIVLLTTDNPEVNEDGLSQIWLFKYNPETKRVLTSSGLALSLGDNLLLDEHLVYNNIINLSQKHPIRDIKSRYENESIGRIVWCDGNNFIGNINVLNPELYNLNPSLIYINPEVSFSKPLITSVSNTGGAIPAFSKVQILYKLVDSSNKETNFSPVSNAVIIPEGNPDNYKEYMRGFSKPFTTEGVNNSGSLTFEIRDIDTNFEFIKLYAVIYNQTNDNLEFVDYRAYEFKTIPVNSFIREQFTFSEGGIIEISSQEINSLNFNASIIPQSIEIHNNRLVALNNSRNSVEFDYDCRAYRFRNDGSTTLTSETGFIPSLNYSSSEDLEEFFNSVQENHDCINNENYLSYINDYFNEDSLNLKFQSDGITVGGEGPNLKYKFTYDTTKYADSTHRWDLINQSEENGPLTFSQTTKILNDLPNQNQTVQVNEFNINSPITNSLITGFMPGEIYRFGLVARDKTGNTSFVNWIGDIKIPDYFEVLSQRNNDSNVVPQVGIEFTFKNQLPENIKSVEFVYVPKNIGNKVVLDYVSLKRIRRRNNDPQELQVDPSGLVSVPDINDSWIIYSPLNQLRSVRFPSNFNLIAASAMNRISKSTSIVGKNREFVTLVSKLSNEQQIINKSIHKVNNVNYLVGNFFEGAADNSIPTQINFQGKNFRNVVQQIFSSSNIFSLGGTGYLFESNINNLGFSPNRVIFLAFKNSNRHGGETFQSRSQNTYTTTGCYLKAENILLNTAYNVWGGDTNGVIRTYQELGLSSEAGSHERVAHLISYPTYTDVPFWFRTKPAVEVGNVLGNAPNQNDKFLQVYNQTLSTQNIYFPKPLRFLENNQFPHEIVVSNRKIDGELTDSWSIFEANNVKNVNGIFGAITKGINYKDKLVFFQERAFGIQIIDERVQSVDTTGQLLKVGDGAILPKENYISTEIGCYHPFSIISLESGLYFFSGVRRNLYKFSEGALPLDIMTGISSEIDRLTRGLLERTDNHFNNRYISAGYDTVNRALRFTFSNGKENATWVYDEFNQVFTTKLTSYPLLYINTDYDLFTVDKYNIPQSSIVLQNFGKINTFRDITYPSEVIYLFKENSEINKIINYIEFQTQFNKDLNNQDLLTTFTELEISTLRDTTEPINLIGNKRLIKRFNKFAYDRIRKDLLTGVGIKKLISGPYFIIRLKIDFNEIEAKKFTTTGLLTNYSIAPV